MKIPLSWLAELVDLPSEIEQLVSILDDLGLVVEGVDQVGDGLESVIVAEVIEIHGIDGADRIRRVVVQAGAEPVEIVCGATNFEVGNFVPFAPVGSMLPGGFEIAQRKMKGVTSNGMLCSGPELGLSDDQQGLMILDGITGVAQGRILTELLGITRDIVLDVSPEGNRPDAWSLEGIARDLSARFVVPVRQLAVSAPNVTTKTSSFATAAVVGSELCGALTVGVIRRITVGPSPLWLQERLTRAGMRPVNNVVDASNYVMLELGQPTHPYDADLISKRHIGVRRAHPGEALVTLDGIERILGQPGRGLGDTGIDCVIVDGDDQIVGLAGIMGGRASEISGTTTSVLLEAAFFDPMTIARTSKRLALRTEASSRFERGVDPTLGARAVARFVELLRLSSPEIEFYDEPWYVEGELPVRPTIEVRQSHVDRLLGTRIELGVAAPLLSAIGFEINFEGDHMIVRAPAARLDVRTSIAGRADVIEEIARLYGYGRLERRMPTWIAPGSLNSRQQFRRAVRSAMVGLGCYEAWTPSLISDADYEITALTPLRVRITNPLAADESVLRSSILVGLVRAWSKNIDRGLGDVALFEIGTTFDHPGFSSEPRQSRGGVDGHEKIELPDEHEILLLALGRAADDARTATATWHVVSDRLELLNVCVTAALAPVGWHPTRHATLTDRKTGVTFGRVGELDPALVKQLAPNARDLQRVGLIEIDLDALADPTKVLRRPDYVVTPSRFPSAAIDLAFVTPDSLNALDLADALRHDNNMVESVELFDVYRGDAVPVGSRSLAFAVRLSSREATLSEMEIAACRSGLIDRAASLGAPLRS